MVILNKIKLTFNCAEVIVNLRGVFRKIALLRVVFTEPKETICQWKANKMKYLKMSLTCTFFFFFVSKSGRKRLNLKFEFEKFTDLGRFL